MSAPRLSRDLIVAMGALPLAVPDVAGPLPEIAMIGGWPHLLFVDELGAVWAWAARPDLPSASHVPAPRWLQ